jgi:hypothetical protein
MTNRPETMQFVEVDPYAVQCDVQTLLFNCPDLDSGYSLLDLTDVDYECENWTIKGQAYLRKSVICLHVYKALEGAAWLNVADLVDTDQVGAWVEFKTKAAAMLWKLGH